LEDLLTRCLQSANGASIGRGRGGAGETRPGFDPACTYVIPKKKRTTVCYECRPLWTTSAGIANDTGEAALRSAGKHLKKLGRRSEAGVRGAGRIQVSKDDRVLPQKLKAI